MRAITTHVYTSESSLRRPAEFVRSALADVQASRHLAWRLFVRNLSTRYRQTALGYLWAFLPPLATTAVFVFLRDRAAFSVGEVELAYAPFVLIGTTLWMAFADALVAPLKMIESLREMLVKIRFPREALVLAAGLEVVFDTLVRAVLVAAVMVAYGVPVAATWWLVPLGVAALIGLGLVLGVFLSPLGVLFQDVLRTLTLLTVFWMFLTPVLYAAPGEGGEADVSLLNPVAPLLVATREWLTTGPASDPGAFWLVVAATVGVLVAAWVLLRIAMPHLIARIGDRA